MIVVGNPNVGKTSIVNAITGAKRHVVNAPGTTLEGHTALWRMGDAEVVVTDLPGSYSLIARTEGERIVRDAVLGLKPGGVALVVVDATAVSRSLYMLAQVVEAGCPAVVAVTMGDVARAHGHPLDVPALAARLGVPVVEVDARKGTGLEELAGAVLLSALAPPELRGLTRSPAAAREAAGEPHDEARSLREAERIFAWIDDVAAVVDVPIPSPRRTVSDRIDRVLLHPWGGVPIFLAVMWGLFEVTTRAAAPLIQGVGSFVAGPVANGVDRGFEAVGLEDSWGERLVIDGLLAGIGTVLSFVPLLALVFFSLGVLEGSGYLARGAVVADRAMKVIGLDGRAVLPLMLGFGCNVPAIAATRSLPSVRQRILTSILIPYTSCSARLTVYILLAAVFFPGRAGTVIFALYVLSIALVVATGLVLRRTALRGAPREPLAIVLPAYQFPTLRVLAQGVLDRLGGFLREAGIAIVVALVAIWLMAAIPVRGGHPLGDVPVADSLFGVTADAVAPVLAPMGLDDWHVTAALMSGVAAKEVSVAALAESYAVGGDGLTVTPEALRDQLMATLNESSGGAGTAAAAAFMVFFLVYAPCVATMAEMKRHVGGRWTATAVLIQLAVAWLVATAVFQIGRLL